MLRNREPQTLDRLSDEEIMALITLNAKLIDPPGLDLPRSQLIYTVDIDVCDKQVRRFLLSEQPDRTNRPMRYWSRSLNNTEEKYDRTSCKYLAAVWALSLLWLYLN